MSLIRQWERSGESPLRAVDVALAETLQRLAPDTDGHVLAGAALASLAVSAGHAAFDPARPQALLGGLAEVPDAATWRRAWQATPWISQPQADEIAPTDAPLVLEQGLLYLRRYREYERALAAGLRRLAQLPPPPADLSALQPLFAALFPQAASGDRQARAAALALVNRLLLVTGGPGTGKTTTIARLLLLLIAQAEYAGRTLRIALAAPTGRAADRMSESLHAAVAGLGAPPALRPQWIEALPAQASTLHRLLGSRPGSPQFRHHAGQPLPFDVIVVDEASMVDLPLMAKLVDAVPEGARLILLGDRDQLPSVEAGDVLAAIGDAAGDGDHVPPAQRAALAPLLGADAAAPASPPPQEEGVQTDLFAPRAATVPDAAPAAPLAGHRVQLLRGYRQAGDFDLAPLADAARAGDAGAALALLHAGTLRGVHYHADRHDPLAPDLRGALLGHWRALAGAADPVQAQAQAARLRLLTALREGPQGAATLNARIEEALAGAQREAYFPGRLLMVTENSYRHGLFNGDVGICLRDGEGALVAWFAGGADGARGFHPAALPAHAGAFALTVHKAQGAEFDQAWIVLPRQDARALSRELVYTALTRARREVRLFASDAVLRAALSRQVQRISGLAGRLR